MTARLVPIFFVSCVLASVQARAAEVDFNGRVAPVLVRRCVGCHNDNEKNGGLNLSRREGLLQGGESGAAIVAGKPDESFLMERVSTGEMPPEDHGVSKKLRAAEIAQIRNWIAAGAVWPDGRVLGLYELTSDARAGLDWWSLQPIVRRAPPAGSEHPIDGFTQARLRKAGMESAPAAEAAALVRRVYFDLVGLPPTADAIEAFVADASNEAYERLIDKLLASPLYGERWARYWLDLVRYADTNGYERDAPKPHAWKYRDWVVRALIDDMPFDRFVVEQLAGDEIPDRTEQSVIATGLLRVGTWDDEPNDPLEYKYERLDDLVQVTSTAVLGISVRCARCHDHKFDPVPQLDYYRFASSFWAGFMEPRDRELMGGPSETELGFPVLGWTDRGREVPPLSLLKKGDPLHPQREVAPAHLSLLPALSTPIAPPPAEAKTTYRRLQLARWMVEPRNPLTPRVIINRLWQHHFGEGLVRTPDNFGFKGDRPTHPELLDYLASDLVASGWRLKHTHKLIMTSAAYRQSSIHPRAADYVAKDADNRLLWRANRRRLDAESLRDAMLLTSGSLKLVVGGPGFYPDLGADLLEGLSMKAQAWGSSPPEQQTRRSLYIFSKRSLLVPLMATFDFCDTTQPCGRRDVSLVAPQALALLNNQFVHDMSAALARRVQREAAGDESRAIELAWRYALGRPPRATEFAAAATHLQAQRERFGSQQSNNAADAALASLCHVLYNTNEFIYVD